MTAIPIDALLTEEQKLQTLAYLQAFLNVEEDCAKASSACFARAILFASVSDHSTILAEADAFARAVLAVKQRRDPNLDPLILATHQALLHRLNLRSEPLAELAAMLALEVDAAPAAVKQQARVRLTSNLLRQAGYGLSPTKLPAEIDALRASPAALLTASDDTLSDLADHLFGEATPLDEDVCKMLSLLAMAMLRSYRMDLGCRLLRLLVSRGFLDQLTRDGIDFVCLQRSSDGGYGFFDPFSEHFADAKRRESDFRLPITVNTLWLFDVLSQSATMAPKVAA